MTRNEQEMTIWREAYMLAMSQDPHPTEASNYADAAVAQFRMRYPVEPAAVWYDEPPFAKDGESRPCWIAGKPFPCAVYWSGLKWLVHVAGDFHVQQLHKRRVSPIVKPPEPPQ